MNPQLLTWARETAGLSLEEGARAIGLNDAYGQKGFERLAAMETGDREPPRSLLVKMAKAYRRSLLVFYLNEPPQTGDRGHDFRTVPGGGAPLYDPDLDALIRSITGRQDLVRSLLEDIESDKVSFIGSATMERTSETLSGAISQNIRFSLSDFRRQASSDLSFNYLRSKIEDSGVFVLLLGDLGSHHSKIPTDSFRGFAIADSIAPFIVINDQDAKAAWSFTAVHELAHLWLGNTGLSGGESTAKIEQYCNDVASHFLVPNDEMSSLAGIQSAPLSEVIAAISTFADERRISRSMVSYKLFRMGFINEDLWRGLSNHFKQQWLETKLKQAEKQKASEGGPTFYIVRRHRLGSALLGLVRRSLGEGLITYTKAGQVLGVKPRNVDPLLRPAGNVA